MAEPTQPRSKFFDPDPSLSHLGTTLANGVGKELLNMGHSHQFLQRRISVIDKSFYLIFLVTPSGSQTQAARMDIRQETNLTTLTPDFYGLSPINLLTYGLKIF